MLRVENMTREDFEFAVSIANTMNWDMAEEDFDFNLKLEPKGCFVLFEDSERIGIVTTISFGKIGWLGNLIVSENHRGKGAGALLAKHAINHLQNEKVETVGLYSYINTIPFYRKLGFKEDSNFLVLRGKGHFSRHISHERQARKSETQKIVDFDSRCLGFSRAKLLKPLLLNSSNFAYVAADNVELEGYTIAKVYDETAQIGPVMCAEGRVEVAINLVSAIIDRLECFEISACVPEGQKTLLDMLIQQGFREDFRVARMFLGEPLGDGCVFAAESLERG
jgi:predicted N-acetyltransferase YhbS